MPEGSCDRHINKNTVALFIIEFTFQANITLL